MTQKQLILCDLMAGKKITPMDALRDYGCWNLGGRINELRFDLKGRYEIKTDINKTGKRYAIYSIIQEKQK